MIRSLLASLVLLLTPLGAAHAQAFFVESSTPAPGTAGVAATATIRFVFNDDVSTKTNWNTAFVAEPQSAVDIKGSNLLLDDEGQTAVVEYEVEHAADTDFTWLVYAVQNEPDDGSEPVWTEPYTLRYTTAATIGSRRVSGSVAAPTSAPASPAGATAAKRTTGAPPAPSRATWQQLVRMATQSGLGTPAFDAPSERTARKSAGAKSDAPPDATSIFLLEHFAASEREWAVRGGTAIAGAAGDYAVDHVRAGTYWPLAVRYADRARTEIEALGFYDADADGEPDPVRVEDTNAAGVDLQLYAFPPATAREYLAEATTEAERYASDQTLVYVEGGDSRPTGSAYEWAYHFYSPSKDQETVVTATPLGLEVSIRSDPGFIREMSAIPEAFVDSDEALQAVLDDGGQAFVDEYWPHALTTEIEGGNLYWLGEAPSSGTFWRIRLIGISKTEPFERFVDMETGEVLGPFEYPETLTFDVTRSFGDPSAQRSYRLVALPGAENTPVASTLEGTAGEDWTVYWDDGTEQNYLKKFDGSSTFTFRPGRGFWMLSKEAWTASGTVDTAPLAADGTYAIDLHDGWNIIANPFDVDVPWSAVQAANGVSAALWRWDGSFEEVATFTSAAEGEAFYFLNEEGLDALKIPYPGAAEEPAPASVARAPEPTLTLAAFRQDERMAAVRAGVAREAAGGRDAFDQIAPPGYFEGAALRLVNDAIEAELAAEYRPAGRDGYAFDLVLHAAPGHAVELRASGQPSFDGQEVLLVDPSAGRTYDLRAAPSVSFRPEAASTPLKLLVGSRAFVERERAEIQPTTLQLLPNFPNPFRGQTTIEFALPRSTAVRLVVYDVLGRRVRTLVEGEVEAGLHPARWDGRNDAGEPVASGLYLARLEAGAQTRVRRLVLVR